MRLDGPEGRHAAAVRRLRVGEAVELVDGHGLRGRGVVAVVDRDAVEIDIAELSREPAPKPRLVVVQALAKGDRDVAAVEAMTEVGVDEVVPWAAARSVVRWSGERGQRGQARWAAVAWAAAKQSRRAHLPEVAPLASTAEVASRLAAATCPIVLHESAERALAGVRVPADGEVVVVVGPEGGISPEELAALPAPAYRLGPSVLRTSTAGVAALAVLASRTLRWA